MSPNVCPPCPRSEQALTIVTFADEGGMTRLTMHTSAAAATAPGAQRLKGVEAGWTQSLERLTDFLATMEDPVMKAGPQEEHRWLQGLVGEWSFEGECLMEPGQPPIRSTGSETVRSLGGLWTMGEGQASSPDGNPVTSVMTLGYDPQKKRFVGTFVASTMAHLWTYKGALDATGKVLTLDTRGPRFAADGKLAAYQDVIEMRNDDHRVLRSRMLGDDGTWREFLTAHYRRTSRQAA